jgi:hypothetical protein
MNAITQLTPYQLRQAADLQEKIVSLQKKLADLLGAAVSPFAQPRKKRTISAAGIARIRAAQKARWAKVRAANK